MTAPFFFDPLPLFAFDLIVVDPPTEFKTRSEKGNSKSGAGHYDIMSWDDIGRLPVGHLARCNAVVALWACPPTLDKSMRLLDQWGAKFKTELVWNKITVNHKPRMGTGYRARAFHESILIGVFGDEYQYHEAFVGAFDGIAREHSRKPDEFYAMMLECTPNAYRCDLFSRETHEGFVGWGNEHGKFDPKPEVIELPAFLPFRRSPELLRSGDSTNPPSSPGAGDVEHDARPAVSEATTRPAGRVSHSYEDGIPEFLRRPMVPA